MRFREDCNLCKESLLKVGDKSEYGAIIILKIGESSNGWFATLSPKTGGDPETDFCIQLIPFAHLKYFSQINDNSELAKNYGIAFARINAAVGEIIKTSEKIPIGTYGKCKHADEHIHIKIFPWRNNIGQPYTTDSTFERKEIYKDENGKEFVKMNPVKKIRLSEERFNHLANLLVSSLK